MGSGEMEDRQESNPFKKMEEEGVPKTDQPSEVALEQEKKEKLLPKLSAKEFKEYNHMAELMNMFHNNFRQTWQTLHTACQRNKRPQNMSLRQFLSLGEQFCHNLTIHHTIEEQQIFPVLAERMECFRENERMITAHVGIHEGIERLQGYLGECRRGEREVRLEEMKGVMDSFGDVLWRHLDEEVEALGAENMRLFWTVEEMRALPM